MGQLRKERLAQAEDSFETSDVFANALARDRLWKDAGALLTVIRADPVYSAARQPLMLTDAIAAKLNSLPRGPGGAREGFLAEAGEAIGDADALEQLIGSVLGEWARSDSGARASPFRDIGVMLPLRLETVFDDLGGSWTLSLRVVPDEVSIRRDKNLVTADEKEFLDEFWARSEVMSPAPGMGPWAWLEHPDGIAAWEQFSAKVTPQRASWLATAFEATLQGGAFAADVPADAVGKAKGGSVFGLPKELFVSMTDVDGNEIDLGSLKPNLPEDHFELPKGEADFDDNWLVSWKRAQEVGMGGVFNLAEGPDRIAALYVYGIGDDSPAELFSAHAASGSLGLVRLGAPTNTVRGAPAADLAGDPETWRKVAGQRLSKQRGAGIALLAEAICGDAKALPALPGPSRDLDDSRLIVAALWPALWGHYARDLLEGGDNAALLWRWCMEALHPEGPLLPVRIDSTPYGVLPITALRQWEPLGGDDLALIEEKIVAGLSQLMPRWIDAAERRGTIVGTDTAGLLDLLARPGVSSRYSYRSYAPARQQLFAYPSILPADFMLSAEKLWSAADEVTKHKMARIYLAQGHPQDLRLPLIGSDRLLPAEMSLRDMVEQLYEIGHEVRFADLFYREFMGGLVPKSLLVRLMIHSALLAKGWAAQERQGAVSPVLNPLAWTDPREETALEQLQSVFIHAPETGGQAEEMMQANRKAILELASHLTEHLEKAEDPLLPNETVMQLKLPPERHAQLERALRATLDTAGHRIDPFATGVAWRRLRAAVSSGKSVHRLGAYGWLDGPFDGKPGPTDAGRLHAPSHAQAMTSIVLRDKQITSRGETPPDSPNVWNVRLSSKGVRMALEMAEDMRLGFHIYEAIGRRVENVVGSKEKVRELRRLRPLRPHAPDRRDTCHGMNALDGLLDGHADLAGILGNDRKQKEDLLAIKSALETYADLLTAEGVHQVVTGQAQRGADAMDAASGFARPPEFDIVKTPPSGYRLDTSVLSVFVHQTPGPDASPFEFADASLANFVAARFSAGAWTWTVKDDENETAVTLAGLSLEPVAAALMREDFLIQAALSKARPAGGYAGVPKVEAPNAHRLSRLLTSAMGSGPALLSDVFNDPKKLDDRQAQVFKNNARDELAMRYKAVFDDLSDLVSKLSAGGADRQGRVALLRKSIEWGFTGPAGMSPTSLLCDVLFGGFDASEEQIRELLAAAHEALKGRLLDDRDRKAAQTPEALSVKLIENRDRRAGEPIEALARAIGALVYPGGRLSVTAKWPVADFKAAAKPEGAPDPALEDQWLAVTAAVRPPLARIEAMQLEARHLGHGLPFGVWSNFPGDPWRKKLVEQNAGLRKTGKLTDIRLDRLVTAFGDLDAFEADNMAVALIDQFSEAVPMMQRSTYAAFGFNAPASRPPQAILLAIPSRADRRLEPAEIQRILRETRDLLRVRAALPGEAFHPVLPTAWLEASSPLRVRLDTDSQFRR